MSRRSAIANPQVFALPSPSPTTIPCPFTQLSPSCHSICHFSTRRTLTSRPATYIPAVAMSLKKGTSTTQTNQAPSTTPLVLTATFPDNFPSSVAFDNINEALNASEADRKDAIKQGNAVFAFTLKNKAGETESWHIDLKQTGKVGTGTGEKPNGEHLPHISIPYLYQGGRPPRFPG